MLLNGALLTWVLAGVSTPQLLVPARGETQDSPPSEPGHGRWQLDTPRCDLSIEGLAHGCSGVRLEQSIAGVLAVRFLAEGREPGVASEELLFVGELQPGHPAMQCSREGRCEPEWPTAIGVLTVAASRYDARGLIMALPRTHLARGSCQLSGDRLVCEASGRDGSRPGALQPGRWRGEARP